jgi:hypothetical protein
MMGLDIKGIFQKKEGDRWVDVASDYYQGRDYALYAWLALGESYSKDPSYDTLKPLPFKQGFPVDFELLEDNVHPVASIDMLDAWQRSDPYSTSPESDGYLKRFMGYGNYCCLLTKF